MQDWRGATLNLAENGGGQRIAMGQLTHATIGMAAIGVAIIVRLRRRGMAIGMLVMPEVRALGDRFILAAILGRQRPNRLERQQGEQEEGKKFFHGLSEL